MKTMPSDPRFSCGPTRKFAKWSTKHLATAPTGRYHRSETVTKLIKDIDLMTREALSIPNEKVLLILPGSSTGAITSILANTLGQRDTQVFSQGVFGETWARDARYFTEKKISHQHAFCAMPNTDNYDPEHDTIAVFNETSVGAKLANLNWISDVHTDSTQNGLTIFDVTSSAFVNQINWNKIDIAIWSWQKALASEAGYGMAVLSEKAVERILTHDTLQPKLFSIKNALKSNNKSVLPIINTLSALTLQDLHFSLKHYLKAGGQTTFYRAAQRKRDYINQWLLTTNAYKDFVQNLDSRSDTVAYLDVQPKSHDESTLIKKLRVDKLLKYLHNGNIAYDIASHRHTPKGVRFWLGPSIPFDDVVSLCDWLEIAYERVD